MVNFTRLKTRTARVFGVALTVLNLGPAAWAQQTVQLPSATFDPFGFGAATAAVFSTGVPFSHYTQRQQSCQALRQRRSELGTVKVPASCTSDTQALAPALQATRELRTAIGDFAALNEATKPLSGSARTRTNGKLHLPTNPDRRLR